MLPDNRVNNWSGDDAVDGSVGINIDPSLPLSPEEVVQQFKQSTSGGSSSDEYIDEYANDQQFSNVLWLNSGHQHQRRISRRRSSCNDENSVNGIGNI